MRHDRPEETRRALLDAGRKLIAERHGHEVPSTVDICARAGLSRGALYARFADRDDFLDALLGELLDELAVLLIRPLVEASTPGDAVGAFLRTALDHPHRAEVGLGGAYLAVLGVLDGHDAVRQRHAAVMDAVVTHLEEVVVRGQDAGIFRSGVRPRDVAHLVILLATTALVWSDLGFDLDAASLTASGLRLLEPATSANT